MARDPSSSSTRRPTRVTESRSWHALETAGEALALQARVLHTLLLREMRATFGKTQLGYLWAILVPALGMSILMLVFSLAGRQPPYGHSFALFFATGLLVLEHFRKMSSSLMSGIEANRALLVYPRIGALDVLAARAMLVSATYAVIFAIFFGGLRIAGLAPLPHDPATLVVAFAVGAWLGTGIGVVNASLVGIWDGWRHVEKVLTRPLIFLSGIFYVPSVLPEAFRDVLWWNPVLHVVEWTRAAFYPIYPQEILTPWYPVAIGTGMMLLGLLLEHATRHSRTLA